MSIRSKIIIILLVLQLIIFNSCVKNEEPVTGIFDDIPVILVNEPQNLTTLNVNPLFDYDEVKKTNDDSVFEVIMIFDKPIDVENINHKITNKQDVLYMWDSTFDNGIPGEVFFTDFKNAVYNSDTKRVEYDDENPLSDLIDDRTYHWVIIAYSFDGEIIKASKQHNFTYDTDYTGE